MSAFGPLLPFVPHPGEVADGWWFPSPLASRALIDRVMFSICPPPIVDGYRNAIGIFQIRTILPFPFTRWQDLACKTPPSRPHPGSKGPNRHVHHDHIDSDAGRPRSTGLSLRYVRAGAMSRLPVRPSRHLIRQLRGRPAEHSSLRSGEGYHAQEDFHRPYRSTGTVA